MQPNDDALGGPKPNGTAAGPAVEPATGEVNGGSSPEAHELLQALQAVRVGDFSVRGGIKTIVKAEYTSKGPKAESPGLRA